MSGFVYCFPFFRALSLNDYDLGGNRLKVEFMSEYQGGKRGGPRMRSFNGRSEGQGSNMPRMGFRQSDFPLR